MHLFINSLAASAGGGLTYIRNVIPHLAVRQDVRVTVVLGPWLREELPPAGNIEYVEKEVSPASRFWYEQLSLPDLIRKTGADVLLSAGNFSIRKSPVPQILLSRNSIYTSVDFYRDLLARGEYRAWLDTKVRAWLARRSIRWADVTVAPSEAFAAELRNWTGKPVRAIHHGFDHEEFSRDTGGLDAEVEAKLQSAAGSVKLLFVSHYNYYRNFETLLRALPILRERFPERSVKLLLTCKLAAGENPGDYRPSLAAQLVKELGIGEMVVELGSVPYRSLHWLYRRADIYVTPAYTETFAHPLVEAMDTGLPVVASDLAVHREICGTAAIYFSRFSPEELSDRLARLIESPEEARRLAAVGSTRSREFSWKKHVEQILALGHSMFGSHSGRVA